MNSRLPASHSIKHNMGVLVSITKTTEIIKKKSLGLHIEGGGVEDDGDGATVSMA
jgi:hypothetical protein